jgi:hypothetical protein
MTNVVIVATNAVLALLMPKIIEFAQRIDLPERGASAAEVRHCSSYGYLTTNYWIQFTNGNEYWFSYGHVKAFQSPRAYYELHGRGQAIVRYVFGFTNLGKSGGMVATPRQFRINHANKTNQTMA